MGLILNKCILLLFAILGIWIATEAKTDVIQNAFTFAYNAVQKGGETFKKAVKTALGLPFIPIEFVLYQIQSITGVSTKVLLDLVNEAQNNVKKVAMVIGGKGHKIAGCLRKEQFDPVREFVVNFHTCLTNPGNKITSVALGVIKQMNGTYTLAKSALILPTCGFNASCLADYGANLGKTGVKVGVNLVKVGSSIGVGLGTLPASISTCIATKPGTGLVKVTSKVAGKIGKCITQ